MQNLIQGSDAEPDDTSTPRCWFSDLRRCEAKSRCTWRWPRARVWTTGTAGARGSGAMRAGRRACCRLRSARGCPRTAPPRTSRRPSRHTLQPSRSCKPAVLLAPCITLLPAALLFYAWIAVDSHDVLADGARTNENDARICLRLAEVQGWPGAYPAYPYPTLGARAAVQGCVYKIGRQCPPGFVGGDLGDVCLPAGGAPTCAPVIIPTLA